MTRPSASPTRARRLLRLLLLLALVGVGGYLALRLAGDAADPQSDRFRQWWQGDDEQRQALITIPVSYTHLDVYKRQP